MKKITYAIIGTFENGRKYGVRSKLNVEGYEIDEYAAVRKNGDTWTLDSHRTGIAICQDRYKTRKAAIEDYENKLKAIVAPVLEDSKKREAMLQWLEQAIPEEILAQYEELDITTTSDRRLDKIRKEAEKSGCTIKEVKEESYQHGGHIKIYGTPGMLSGVRTMNENYAAIDKENAGRKEKEMEEKKNQKNQQTTEQQEIDVSALTEENLKDYLTALVMELNRDKHNSSIIMSAAIAAGKVTATEVLAFFQRGWMPAIHTVDIWNRGGKRIKAGEKAAFDAYIWQYVDKSETLTAEQTAAMNAANMIEGIEYHEGDTINKGEFIKRKAYFFRAEQVEDMPELPELPEDVKKEKKGNTCWISGNTKPIKDALKAAGFRWSKKRGAWYRREAA